MANFGFQAKLSSSLEQDFSSSKLQILEALAYGYSNQSIANEYKVSVKAVEQSITFINEKFGAKHSFYSSRVRIIAYLLANELLRYEVDDLSQFKKIDLKRNLEETLTFIAAGLSNSTVAKICGVSDKSIEQRLSHLFDYFAIDTKNQKIENPRVLLVINACLRGNIDHDQLAHTFNKTMAHELEAQFLTC